MDLLEAARLVEEIELLREKAGKVKDPEKAAEIDLRIWELSMRLKYRWQI